MSGSLSQASQFHYTLSNLLVSIFHAGDLVYLKTAGLAAHVLTPLWCISFCDGSAVDGMTGSRNIGDPAPQNKWHFHAKVGFHQ